MKNHNISIKFVAIILASIIGISIIVLNFPDIIKSTKLDIPPISYSQKEYEQPTQEINSFNMLFVGDVMLARSIGYAVQSGDNPFRNVKSTFDKYDLVIANLETVASEDQYAFQNPNKLFTFNAPVSTLDTLTQNGIDVVSLANNHTMDFGSQALMNTIQNLKNRGVLYAGAGNNVNEAFEPKYIFHNKTTIALLAFNDIENWVADATENTPGSANFDKQRIKESLEKANANADIVIVFPHWGIEYSLTNSDRQSEYARYFIDNGADIVIGAHPHVLQNSEEYNKKMIYYSLGNFVFDDMCTIPNACSAGMVEILVEDREVKSSRLISIRLADNGFPELE